MANSSTLKEYLKTDIQQALGIRIESQEFDRVMGAIASAVDRYLKNDIQVDIGIEAEGTVAIPPAASTPPPVNPSVAEPSTLVEVVTTTPGKLV